MSRPRIRHVWVRPAYGVGTPRAGLVIAWRRVPSKSSGPMWQAQVVVYDERDETLRIGWHYASELEPVGHADTRRRADRSMFGGDTMGTAQPGSE